MERYVALYVHTLTASFDLFAAWHKGALTLPGGITVPTNGSWQYIVLTADEATNTITWAVYNLDGSEYGTGSHEYGREVTGDIDITFTGHTDELVYDEETALTEAKLTEVLEYRLPWGDGLDASKTWLVLHAKDPAAVESNAFLTKRNPAALGEFSVRDLDDEEDWFSVGADEIVSHKPHKLIKGQVYQSSLITGGTVSHTIYHVGSGTATTAWAHIATMPFPTSSTHDILRIQMTGGAWVGAKGHRIIAYTARNTIAASYLGAPIPNVLIEIYNNGTSYDVYIMASTTNISVIAEVTAYQTVLGTGVIRTTTPPGTLAWSAQ